MKAMINSEDSFKVFFLATDCADEHRKYICSSRLFKNRTKQVELFRPENVWRKINRDKKF
jgi:hypothetical protein